MNLLVFCNLKSLKFFVLFILACTLKLVHHFVFRLTADDIREGTIIPLSFVKFQNVSRLTVSIVIIFGWFRSLLIKDATNDLNTFVAKNFYSN